MRILHVDTGREMRGGQWQVIELVRGLIARGDQCLLLAPRDSMLLGRAVATGLPARPLTAASLWRESRRHDVVHAHSGRAHTLAAVAASCRLVVSRRVAFPIGRDPASRWKYRRAARYIAVSEYVRGTLTAAAVLEDRVVVIYDGSPLLAESSRRGGAVAPATDDPRKGTALVRRAASLGGFDVRYTSQLRADLADAGLLVYLSDEEGLGSGVLLAMSAGVPVVASRVGGLIEIVEDEVTGLLVENQPAAVAAAVNRLRADPERARAMGLRGRERVRTEFTLEKMVARTADVYREVIK